MWADLSGGDRHPTDIATPRYNVFLQSSSPAAAQVQINNKKFKEERLLFQEEPGSICIAFVWIICNFYGPSFVAFFVATKLGSFPMFQAELVAWKKAMAMDQAMDKD